MATLILSNVVCQTITSLRNRRKNDANQESCFDCDDDNMCPICWNALPSDPKILPCGHKFCRKCIRELKSYQAGQEAEACCPMCRGPLKAASAKQLWREAKRHEKAGNDYFRLQQVETRITLATRHMVEAQREYKKAVAKLKECLQVLNDDRASRSRQNHCTSRIAMNSITRRDSKRQYKQVRILCKMIEIVPMAGFEDGDERCIELLRTALRTSNAPMPHLNLKLAKLLHRQLDESLLDDVKKEYRIILEIARFHSGMASRQAKKLQGQAHYGLARCYHQLGNYKRAIREYYYCERFNALQDYGLAAECHFFIGNYLPAIEYCSMQLRKESTYPAIETLLLMARIFKAYFLSLRSYRRIDALDYQSRYEAYRRCVRHAQLLAKNDHQQQQCSRHMELLYHLMTPIHNKGEIQPTYCGTGPSSWSIDQKDDDKVVLDDDEDKDSSGCADDDDLETEECDSDTSVEL